MQAIVFIFLCIVWGTTWVAIKVSLEGFPPFLGASARFLVAILFLLLYIRWKRIPLTMPKKEFGVLSLSAFLMYTLDYGLVYWGEQYLSAGVTAIFFATFPLFTGLWANFLFRHEPFRWNKFLGLVVGFVGIIIVFYDQLMTTDFNRMIIFATLAIITGAAGGAMAVVIIKKYLPEMHPITLSFHQMLQGLFFLAVLGLLLEHPSAIHLNRRVLTAVVYLGMVGSALAFGLYYWLLQQVSAITLSLIIYITPVMALLFDYLIYGEVIQPQAVVGMLVIFTGIGLTELERYRHFLRTRKRR